MQYNFSIIIPHYNIPQLLMRCISSIPQQNDIQVLVVDDCSNSDSVAKLKEMESQFSWIQFIYQNKNLGGGAARNKGLSLATGKYVLFIDADDYFNYCIRDVFQQYKDSDNDIIFFNAISIDSDLYTQTYRCSHINKIFELYKKDPAKAEFQMRYAYGEPWGKLIRRDFIEEHDIRFEETKIHNDTQFSYMTGYYAKKIAVDMRALNSITSREGSVSKQISNDRLETRVQVFAKQFQFLHQNHIEYLDDRIFLTFDYCEQNHLKDEEQACYKIAEEFGLSKSILQKKHRRIKLKRKIKSLKKRLSKIKKII